MYRLLKTLVVLVLLLSVVNCARPLARDAGGAGVPTTPGGTVENPSTSVVAGGAPASALSSEGHTPGTTLPPAADSSIMALAVIRFAYDSFLLDAAARAAAEANYRTMSGTSGRHYLLTGHCDERGADNYNIALGERRALTVRDYLVGCGLDPARLEVVSYGELRPSVTGHDEAAWAINRRVEVTLLP